ncbi:MAG: esterase [Gemmatimonadota bacterium]
MDLIERYLEAVAARLQPKRRGEVERELRASILDALEARGASPESEEDVAAVLAELGEPSRVAAGYEPGSQYLIGPELYPLFRRVIRVTLYTLVGASALYFAVALLLGGQAEFRAGDLLKDTLETALGAAVLAVVVIGVVFAWLQRSEVNVPARSRPGDRWDPRSLPSVSGPDRASRFDSVVGLVATAVALVILGGIGQAAAEALPVAAAGVRPIIRHAVLQGVMLLQAAAALSALAHAVALIQGRWRPYTRAMRLAADALAVFVFVRVPVELVIHRAALLESDLSRNFVLWLVLTSIVVGAIGVGVIVGLSVHAWRGRNGRSGAGAVGAPVLVALAILFAALPAAARAQTAPEVRSPEVHADGSVTFRYRAPDAEIVALLRSGERPVPMAMDADGVWSHTIDPLPPDIYDYYFAVDSSPAYDPSNPDGVPVVTGFRKSLFQVPGPDSLPWERSGAPAGKLELREYRSQTFEETRPLWVYLPPGYDKAAERTYPVLYLLHGVMEDARAWSTVGRVDVILDNLIARGAVEPMIVMMPLGYGFPDAASRASEMLSPVTDQLAVAEALAAGLLGEVVPLVDREYRTRAGAGSRAIAGVSMGGSQALYVGLNHPETFDRVVSLSGAWIMYGGRYDAWFPAVGSPGGRLPGFVDLSVGREDFLLGVNRHFVAWLAERGTRMELREVDGGHTWSVWRRELGRVVPLLFFPESS